MKLLYITRKFPPAVGGMEKYSYHLANELSSRTPTQVISWGGSQKWLPYFVLKALVQALWLVPTKGITHIHMGDGVLAPLGVILKSLTRRPTSITIMGLDITYKNPVYQKVIPAAVMRLDKVICISRATLEECVKRGIPRTVCTFIPIGVYSQEIDAEASRSQLTELVGFDLTDKKILLTVGRLVKRKGVAWFVENVMPQLEGDFIYLIAGVGAEREKIESDISRLNLASRVKVLGAVSDDNLKLLYRTANLLVMPNIKVDGDMEGFGIVAVEASSVGLPVVASDLEGIKDAVLNGVTGVRVPWGSGSEFINAIRTTQGMNRDSVRKNTLSKFSWPAIAASYKKVLEAI